MVQCDELLLDVSSGSHLLRGAYEHANLTAADLAEQLLLFDLRIGGVDIGDLFSGDSFLNELLSEVVIHIELAVVVRRGQ